MLTEKRKAELFDLMWSYLGSFAFTRGLIENDGEYFPHSINVSLDIFVGDVLDVTENTYVRGLMLPGAVMEEFSSEPDMKDRLKITMEWVEESVQKKDTE